MHLVEPEPKRLPVTQHFLGGWVGERLGVNIVLEQFVMGGDDVLDFGAVLGLLQTEGVDKDGLVRNGPGQPLEFGQASADGRQLVQDGGRVKPGGSRVSRGFILGAAETGSA